MKKFKQFIVQRFPFSIIVYDFFRYGTFKTKNKWPEEKLIGENMKLYKKLMGYTFDISHPVLFTEKIQWYKYYYKGLDFARITDKVLFKQYIADKLGEQYVTPTYGVWNSVDELEKEWDKLPEEFVLKANLSSHGNNIVFIHHKSSENFKALKKQISSYFLVRNTNLNSFSCNLYRSVPRVFAEKFISDGHDTIYDYRIFCFNGKIAYITLHIGDNIAVFDDSGHQIPLKYGILSSEKMPLPKHIEEMKDAARKLSEGIPHVRVDMYDTDEQFFVGELTFDTDGGYLCHLPENLNRSLGDLFVLPE